MASKRRLIREAIKKALLGKTLAGANVFSNLSSSVWREELPAIFIYSRAEDVQVAGQAPLEYRRVIEMAVEIMAEGSEDPDQKDGAYVEDILDEMADQVETLLNKDSTLGETIDPYTKKKVALVDDLTLQTVEFDFDGEGQRPAGACKLIFSVTYHEFRPLSMDEQDDISDFKGADVQWDVGHNAPEDPDEVIEAEDTITIPD